MLRSRELKYFNRVEGSSNVESSVGVVYQTFVPEERDTGAECYDFSKKLALVRRVNKINRKQGQSERHPGQVSGMTKEIPKITSTRD